MINFIYILVILMLSGGSLIAQENDTWLPFYNQDSTLIGYKDKYGIVKIKPKFKLLFPHKFDNIVAVTEEIDGKFTHYYLTKSGICGQDSLYYFDNTTDCESEGYIRFRDAETNKVGMFNSQGKIVIPAIYDDMTPIRNSMAVGLKGAEKIYWDKEANSGCNHYSWIGGQEALIDTLNNILIENFSNENSLNFFSIEKTNLPHSDTIRKSFLAKDGAYYSFVDYEKEFRQWLFRDLLNDLTSEKLYKESMDTIEWSNFKRSDKTVRAELLKSNFLIIKNRLLEILKPECEYHIYNEELNSLIFEGPEYDKYFDNCGESKYWKYPTMSVVINHENSQNTFEFLRSDYGYKLIAVTIMD